jgi:hypothetical protein
VNSQPRALKELGEEHVAHSQHVQDQSGLHHRGCRLALPAGLGIGLAAEQPSPEDIIRALKPARITRGLTASPGDRARRAEEAPS